VSGLILPDTVAPKGEQKLVLPDTVRTHACGVCGENFISLDRYMRHVPACARRHRESLVAETEEHRAEVDADPFRRVWDPEALEWVVARRRERLGY
jgi:hypothetical protein